MKNNYVGTLKFFILISYSAAVSTRQNVLIKKGTFLKYPKML